MQQLGDTDAWHHRIEPISQCFGVGCRDRANGGYLEAFVAVSHTIQSIALQAPGEFLQAPVQFAAPLFEPFAGCRWQAKSRHDRLGLRFAEQVAVEPAVSRRSLHPDIPGTQLVAQMRDRRDFPESPIDLAVIANNDFPPFFAEGHRSVGRQIALARPVEVTLLIATEK